MTEQGDEMVMVPRGEWEAMKSQLARLVETAGVGEAAMPPPVPVDRRSVLRRGAMLAAGAVAGGAGLAMVSAQPASAANGGSVLLGESNTATLETDVTNSAGNALAGITTANGGIGLAGMDESESGGYGLYGASSTGLAIYANSVESNAVSATSHNDTSVVAQSYGGHGLSAATSNPPSDIVPITPSPSTSTEFAGVLGQDTTAGGGYGVWGQSEQGVGVYGQVQETTNANPAVSGTTAGTGPAVLGEITNAASSADAVGGVTVGTGAGFGGLSYGSGAAVEGVTEGTGPAMTAQIIRATNTQPAVSATTNGTGPAIQGTGTSANSRGGVFAGGAAQAQLTPSTAITTPPRAKPATSTSTPPLASGSARPAAPPPPGPNSPDQHHRQRHRRRVPRRADEGRQGDISSAKGSGVHSPGLRPQTTSMPCRSARTPPGPARVGRGR